ncbi:MAG: hypothetical protein ACKO5C_06870 [Ferruginibacter sp.]
MQKRQLAFSILFLFVSLAAFSQQKSTSKQTFYDSLATDICACGNKVIVSKVSPEGKKMLSAKKISADNLEKKIDAASKKNPAVGDKLEKDLSLLDTYADEMDACTQIFLKKYNDAENRIDEDDASDTKMIAAIRKIANCSIFLNLLLLDGFFEE